VTLPESIVLAVVSAAFSCGVTIATLWGKVDQALRTAQRAHSRIDELEQQTGTHTVLRADEPLTGGIAIDDLVSELEADGDMAPRLAKARKLLRRLARRR
jgi:hypothetical protein